MIAAGRRQFAARRPFPVNADAPYRAQYRLAVAPGRRRGRRPAMNRRLRRDVVRAAIALLAAFVVTTVAVRLLFSRGLVVGDFMAPALRDGDAIVVDLASGRFVDYRAGEIVSLQIPGEPRGRVLRRVLGGPGDPVLASGTLLRALGPDEFVLHDELARDGRAVVERDDIEGRVLLRAWPLSRLKWRPGLEP
jgi:signal peptidase I